MTSQLSSKTGTVKNRQNTSVKPVGRVVARQANGALPWATLGRCLGNSEEGEAQGEKTGLQTSEKGRREF